MSPKYLGIVICYLFRRSLSILPSPLVLVLVLVLDFFHDRQSEDDDEHDRKFPRVSRARRRARPRFFTTGRARTTTRTSTIRKFPRISRARRRPRPRFLHRQQIENDTHEHDQEIPTC